MSSKTNPVFLTPCFITLKQVPTRESSPILSKCMHFQGSVSPVEMLAKPAAKKAGCQDCPRSFKPFPPLPTQICNVSASLLCCGLRLHSFRRKWALMLWNNFLSNKIFKKWAKQQRIPHNKTHRTAKNCSSLLLFLLACFKGHWKPKSFLCWLANH